MATVIFAFGNRPVVDGDDALDLADLLGYGDNPVAHHAAAKIRAQAMRDPDREIGCDITLEPEEMEMLLALLREPSETPDPEAIQNLRAELERELRSTQRPSGCWNPADPGP